jgi:hypothetical protein
MEVLPHERVGDCDAAVMVTIAKSVYRKKSIRYLIIYARGTRVEEEEYSRIYSPERALSPRLSRLIHLVVVDNQFT